MDNDNSRGPKGLAGARATIIGGSGGIGWALAKALAPQVGQLTLHGRDRAKLDARVQELSMACLEVASVAADLSGADAPESLLDATRRSDVLAVCYGPFVHKPLAQTSAADWRLTALACLALPGMLAAEAAKAMSSRGFGRILLFGGTRTDAVRGYRGNAAYAAAKTGLGVLAKSIAGEFGRAGVSAAVVCPGFVDTEYLDPGAKAAWASAAPRGRLTDPADIAALASYLLGGGIDLVNGSVINADEGLLSW